MPQFTFTGVLQKPMKCICTHGWPRHLGISDGKSTHNLFLPLDPHWHSAGKFICMSFFQIYTCSIPIEIHGRIAHILLQNYNTRPDKYLKMWHLPLHSYKLVKAGTSCLYSCLTTYWEESSWKEKTLEAF